MKDHLEEPLRGLVARLVEKAPERPLVPTPVEPGAAGLLTIGQRS